MLAMREVRYLVVGRPRNPKSSQRGDKSGPVVMSVPVDNRIERDHQSNWKDEQE